MQEQLNNEEDQVNDPRTENEIKKIKLSLEHGMDFSNSFSDPHLPPEVECEFLDYIGEWEKQFAANKTVSVYEMAGNPEWKPAAEIGDHEIRAELDRIMEALNKNDIILDTLCEVKDRELYRFITEELFIHETNDIRIPGMMHAFTYEEFHPNHEYDIKNQCTELITHITDKEENSDLEPWGLADKVWYGAAEFTKEELNKKLINFRDSFSSFTIHLFEYTSVDINEEKNAATSVADIHYSAVIDGGNDTIDFKGECKFYLRCDCEWWVIYRFEVPGVAIESTGDDTIIYE